MEAVRTEQLSKSFGSVAALRAVDLRVQVGELLTLLGPSGCGKTTLLRLLAGLETPSLGGIYFGARRVDAVPTHLRNIGMVFQSYALFPHLTVAENVAYGLRARRTPSAQLQPLVAEALALVQMSDYGARRPDQLSGGQQQRVALARALATRPALLLMDEPLSNLDVQLRTTMRAEIRRLQKQLGITTVYVTHDQEEALAISDRIAVLHGGELQQIDAPAVIYRQPQNRRVASFLGTCSFLAVEVRDGRVHGGGDALGPAPGFLSASKASLGVRPESLRLLPEGHAPDGDSVLHGVVEDETFQGAATRLQVRLSTGERVIALSADPRETVQTGAPVRLGFRAADVMFFDETTGRALR